MMLYKSGAMVFIIDLVFVCTAQLVVCAHAYMRSVSSCHTMLGVSTGGASTSA
jgi:hypothetical protein